MRIIAVVSGKGGVGKTTVTANLGVALSEFGFRVTLVDFNVTTSHLGFYFSFSELPITLNNVLRGETHINNALYVISENLSVIPASLSIEELAGVNLDKLRDVLKDLNSEIVLIDSAPGLGREGVSSIKAADELIYVTIPYLSAVTDILRIHKVALELGKYVDGIITNMVRGKKFELKRGEIEELTGIRVIGEIPFDNCVQESLAKGFPTIRTFPFAKSSIEIKKIASKLVGVPYSPPKRLTLKRIGFNLKRRIFGIEQQKIL
ncbi:MAG: cell division ATPase MinD [Candidatus Aenigmarchaeota archaeon]|nr:cell division ATPase MinD [Candidatus Aenigmarchaeota archaeon]